MLYDLTEKEAELIESFRVLQPRIQEPILTIVLGFRDVADRISDVTVSGMVRALTLQREADPAQGGTSQQMTDK